VPPMPEGEPHIEAAPGTAAEFIIKMVHKYPGEVVIWAGGPLTNIALALRLDPQVATLAKSLVLMGSGMYADNGGITGVDGRREFNWWFDPEAVRIVMRAPWKSITITPIDFHADVKDKAAHHGFLNIWTRSLDPEDIDKLVDTYGVLPGEFMSSVFSMMTPMRSLTKYNVDLIDVIDDEAKFMNFLRMEKWLADRPHHPGEAAKQWLKDLYQDNKLIKNAFMINGRQVDLRNLTMPVLNVFAKDDHIIPPATSQALGAKVGTRDYTELALAGGHVGVFVGGKSQALLGSGIAKWLAGRE